jgi:two-component system chemotaxis response regulator CheB
MKTTDFSAPNQPIGVLIVEDSITIRRFLDEIVSADPRLRVLAAVESGEEALRLMERLHPDVISLDIRLPGMSGFEFTHRVMSWKPTPIVVCSASVETSDLGITMNSLKAGALSVVEKPVALTNEHYARLAERLCTQLAVMSRVKVVRQWGGDPASRPSPPLPQPSQAVSPGSRSRDVRAIGIVASTGGPSALTTVLNTLGPDFPVPVLVVQHITATFADGFIDWLGTVCELKVVRGESGQCARPGHVYVAPGDRHLLIRSGVLHTNDGPPISMQRPSGDVLLTSLAAAFAAQAVGVLLTGMGEDGADGLLALRRAGGYTIAEDRSTAVVFGMPAAAEKRGAVCESLPIHAVGPRLLQLVNATVEVFP